MKPLRMVMVDDDWMDAELLQEHLEASPLEFDLEHVADGGQALSKLRHGGELPHLVIFDLNMPGKGGTEILQEIRNDPRLWKLAVLV